MEHDNDFSVMIGNQAGAYYGGENSIFLGDYASKNSNENYQFVFSANLGNGGKYTRFETIMTPEEFEVVRAVVLRATQNSSVQEIPLFYGHDAGESVIDK